MDEDDDLNYQGEFSNLSARVADLYTLTDAMKGCESEEMCKRLLIAADIVLSHMESPPQPQTTKVLQ